LFSALELILPWSTLVSPLQPTKPTRTTDTAIRIMLRIVLIVQSNLLLANQGFPRRGNFTVIAIALA
jgi:hypothetical protein